MDPRTLIRSGITSDISFYASRPDVTLQAIDAPRDLVETVTRPRNEQPTSPNFSVWEFIGVSVAQSVIDQLSAP